MNRPDATAPPFRTHMAQALSLEPRAQHVLGLHVDALPPALHSLEYAAVQPQLRVPTMRVNNDRWRNALTMGLADRYQMVIGTESLHWLRTHARGLFHNQITHLLALISQRRVALTVMPENTPIGSLPRNLVILRGVPQHTDRAYRLDWPDWIPLRDASVHHLVQEWEQTRAAAMTQEDTFQYLQHALETGDLPSREIGDAVHIRWSGRSTPISVHPRASQVR